MDRAKANFKLANRRYTILWISRRFGFVNPQAVAEGKTGTEVRGEEHDITLVWSITSGKRLVLADGHEVHISSSRSSVFDFSWSMKGGNIVKVIAHASPPLSDKPGFRQYDMLLNGQSFFSFPKMFRAGAPTVRRSTDNKIGHPNYVGVQSQSIAMQEEAELQRAIQASLADTGPVYHLPAGVSNSHKAEVEDLLDFGNDPLPEPIVTSPMAHQQPQNSFNQFYPTNYAPAQQPPPVNPYAQSAAPPSFSMPPSDVNSVFSAPSLIAPNQNPFGVAPTPASSNQFAPTPTIPVSGTAQNAIVMHPQQQTGNYSYGNYSLPPPLHHHQQNNPFDANPYPQQPRQNSGQQYTNQTSNQQQGQYQQQNYGW